MSNPFFSFLSVKMKILSVGFMLFLVLSLNFSLAIVHSYEVYGSSKVNGVVSSMDNVFLNVTGSERYSLYSSAGTLPMDCIISQNGRHICSKNFEFSEISNFGKRSFSLKGNESGAIDRVSVIVDGIAPVLNSYEMIKQENGYKVSYSLSDVASDEDLGCANVKNIEFYVDGSLKHNELLNLSPSENECFFESDFFVDMSGVYGGFEYYFKVYDNVGNYFTSEVEYRDNVDFVPPEVDDDFMIVYAGSSNVLNKIPLSSDAPLLIDILVFVEDINNVTEGFANLTDLSKNPLVAYDNYRMERCTYVDEHSKYLCKFGNVFLDPADEVISLGFMIFDNAGNSVEKTIVKEYEVLDGRSDVSSLVPANDRCLEDRCFVKPGINEMVLFIESDSEFNFNNVYLTPNQVRANDCYKNDLGWTCKFFINYGEDSGIVSSGILSQLSADDFGNHLEPVSFDFVLDSDAPVIDGMSVLLNGDDIEFENLCPTSYDDVTFLLNVSDDSPELSIGTNASSYSDLDLVLSKCDGIGNHKFICELNIDQFVEGFLDVSTGLYVEDIAGNRVYLNDYINNNESLDLNGDKFDTCVMQDGIPNLINSIELSDTFVSNCLDGTSGVCANALAMRKKSHRILLPLEFQSNADVLFYELGGCFASLADNDSADDFVSNVFIQRFDLSNSDVDALLVVDLGGDGLYYDGSKILLECDFRFKIKIGNSVYNEFEEDNFFQEILVEDKFEDINLQVANKIKVTKKRLKELDGKIKNRQKYLTTFQFICGTVDTMNMIKGYFTSIKTSVYAISVALSWAGIGDGIWKGVNGGVLNPIEKVISVLLPSSKYALTLSFVDIGCAVARCSFYKSTGLLEIGFKLYNTISNFDEFGTDEEDIKKKKAEKQTELEDLKKQKDELDSESGKLVVELVELNKEYEECALDNTELLTNIIRNRYDVEAKLSDLHSELNSLTDQIEDVNSDITYLNQQYPSSNEGDSAQSGNTQNNNDDANSEKKGIKESLKESWGKVTGFFKGSREYVKTEYDNDMKDLKIGINRQFNKNIEQESALEGDWIVNPYKSTKLDNLCLPATVYNLKKEKQLQCKYLKCLKTVDDTGLPISVCEDMKELEHCLYLEGAWTKKYDGNYFKMITDGMLKSIQQSWPMISVRVFDFFVCDKHGPNAVLAETSELNLPTGWLSWICAVEKTYFSVKEIMSIKEKTMYDKWDVDLNGRNFCDGVDYND
jgi:hypothetical protein